MDIEKISFITQRFFCNSKVSKIDLVDSGLINETYIVEHISNGAKSKFIFSKFINLIHELKSIK